MTKAQILHGLVGHARKRMSSAGVPELVVLQPLAFQKAVPPREPCSEAVVSLAVKFMKLCARNFPQLAFMMAKPPNTSALQHLQLVARIVLSLVAVVVRLHAISLPASKGGQSSLSTSDVFRDYIASNLI